MKNYAKIFREKVTPKTEDEFTNNLLDFKWLLPLRLTEYNKRVDSFCVTKQKDKEA